MAVNTENIRRWIEQSDIDYISQYIKAWIPFNAWYNAEFSDLEGDRVKINKIKNEANTIRRKFNTLMEGDGQISEEFRSYLSSLHSELQNIQIDSTNGRIWFFDIVKSKNPIDQINETKNQIRYYLKREDKQRLGEINKIELRLSNSRSDSVFSYTCRTYDLTHLQSNPDYNNLSNTQKENLRLCFERLKPVITHKVIQENREDEPKNYYTCDGIHFVRDVEDSYCPSKTMCKCLIETLYQLRNVLFHGELVPNVESQKVYKNAYFCLKYLLESLK